MDKKSLDLYSWVIRGTQRIAIVKVLDKLKTPKQLSQETKLKFSNVSDVLNVMKKKELVICLNPKEKTGRLYQLTKKGLKIQKELGVRDT
jgi:predicted transcriptional regulator